LIWIARDENLGALRQALLHDDPAVKYRVALGLAYAGDPSVTSLAFSTEADKVLTDADRLAAAVALGPAGEDRLALALDQGPEPLRNRALLLLLMKEWKVPEGTAARLLACLAARAPRMRLAAARGLEVFADPASFAAFVVQMVNDRGEKPAWQIAAPVLDDLAQLLTLGAPQVQARTTGLLANLEAEEQAAWDQSWTVHAVRFAPEIADARERARRRPLPTFRYSPAELGELAFGAYVGLVRENGAARGKGPGDGAETQAVKVRQTAIDRLLALARSDPHFAGAARPVFVQALGDPNQAVRLRAFQHLQTLGMEPAAMAVEALATGHADLGVEGLQLLARGGSAAEGEALFEQAMLTRPDELAIEAARLLTDRRGAVFVAGKALDAAHEPLRKQAVAWLAAEYDRHEPARDRLRQALASRYREVRESAALELATKKDSAAFEALVGLLKDANEPARQRRAIEALVRLGDPRAPDALLDRLENDPAGTAGVPQLIQAAGWFRLPKTADRLLALTGRVREWKALDLATLFTALSEISGYDQPIFDPEDERPDPDWESRQHPRRDDILARMLERFATLSPLPVGFINRLLPSARWARGKDVEPVLASLSNLTDEASRRQAVEALGWRLRKRGASPEPLLRLLGHRDPVTQFLAAEALAKVGRAEGLNVLLASVDFVTDLSLRRRAVLALGELADERALDPLLRFAGEEGHALQDSATEAIGHLGRSAKADEIFKILERHAKGDGSLAENALRGLRWLNTRAAWQLIRRRAADESFGFRATAATLLGHDDDPATRDLLLRLLADADDDELLAEALAAARRLWGPESLEPDYAAIQSVLAEEDEEFAKPLLERLAARGEPRRLLEILPRCREEIPAALAAALLGRPTLPVAEARAAVASPEARTVWLAARILGRAGRQADESGSESGEPILTALRKWRDAWEEQRRKRIGEDEGDSRLAEVLTPCLRSLVWAAGRWGIGRDDLIAMAAARPGDPEYRSIRGEVVAALAASERTPEVVGALEAAAVGADPEVRFLAADAVGRLAPEQAPALAERLLADRASFQRLADHAGDRLGEVLRAAASQVHSQGVVLPFLIGRGDVEGLAAVAEDRTLPEATRLGAIEGLAAIARAPAVEVLRRIGLAPDEDEELRKAAWRGLRRSKRARTGAGTPHVEVKP
jgi:ParB family chromosome partitioning protein